MVQPDVGLLTDCYGPVPAAFQVLQPSESIRKVNEGKGWFMSKAIGAGQDSQTECSSGSTCAQSVSMKCSEKMLRSCFPALQSRTQAFVSSLSFCGGSLKRRSAFCAIEVRQALELGSAEHNCSKPLCDARGTLGLGTQTSPYVTPRVFGSKGNWPSHMHPK